MDSTLHCGIARFALLLHTSCFMAHDVDRETVLIERASSQSKQTFRHDWNESLTYLIFPFNLKVRIQKRMVKRRQIIPVIIKYFARVECFHVPGVAVDNVVIFCEVLLKCLARSSNYTAAAIYFYAARWPRPSRWRQRLNGGQLRHWLTATASSDSTSHNSFAGRSGTRSSATAGRPRDAIACRRLPNGRRNDNLGWNDLQMYFKVIKSGTNRKLVYDFLLVLCSNFCRRP